MCPQPLEKKKKNDGEATPHLPLLVFLLREHTSILIEQHTQAAMYRHEGYRPNYCGYGDVTVH